MKVEMLREELNSFFKTIGLGEVEIIRDAEGSTSDSYLITVQRKVFEGFFPKEKEFVLYWRCPKHLDDKFEGIRFRIIEEKLIPSKFVIQKYPERQTLYLNGDDEYTKGDLVYINHCHKRKGKTNVKLKKPIFFSSIKELNELLLNRN